MEKWSDCEEFDTVPYFDDSRYRTFADVLADREASSTKPRAIDKKVKTETVACLRITDGPRGCTGIHCELDSKCCREKVCIERLQQKTQTVKNETDSKAIGIDEYLETNESLLAEILNHCRTDSLYYPTMEESRLALESALGDTVELGTCDCVACQILFEQKRANMVKRKLEAAKIRYKVLSEYRRAQDKEALARTSEG